MFTQALIGKLSWERKAHVGGILGSVPIWPDVVSSFQDKRTWTFSYWYFLASQARNWEEEMVIASLIGNRYEMQTAEGFLEASAQGIWGRSYSLSL